MTREASVSELTGAGDDQGIAKLGEITYFFEHV
jgi:hypothetical protein